MRTLRFMLVRGAVLVLLVTAGIGLQAGSPLDADSSRWSADRLLSDLPNALKVVALLAFAGILLIAVRSLEGSGGPPQRKDRGRIMGDFVVLAGFVLVALAWPDPHRGRRVPPSGTPSAQAPDGTLTHTTASHDSLLLVLALAALVVVAIVLAARRRSAVAEAPDEDVVPAVSEGLAAAARVLRERQHEAPRERVLSAYEAFEQALAAHGVERGPSGTATALLARAVDAGVPAEAAEALTRLFGTARFSDAPVTEQDVTAAERALDVLLAPR